MEKGARKMTIKTVFGGRYWKAWVEGSAKSASGRSEAEAIENLEKLLERWRW